METKTKEITKILDLNRQADSNQLKKIINDVKNQTVNLTDLDNQRLYKYKDKNRKQKQKINIYSEDECPKSKNKAIIEKEIEKNKTKEKYLKSKGFLTNNLKYGIYNQSIKIYDDLLYNKDNTHEYLIFYEKLAKLLNINFEKNKLLNEDDKLILLGNSFKKALKDYYNTNNFDQENINNNLNNYPNFIRKNIIELLTQKRCSQKFDKEKIPLYKQNINKIQEKNKFNRKEVIKYYSLYNSLCKISINKMKDKWELFKVNGIDFDTFKFGVIEIFILGEELKKRIFSSLKEQNKDKYTNFITIDSFLYGMKNIKAKSLQDKIDLFIQIADEDGNGNLSKEEIYDLSKISLGVFINQNDSFLEEMSEYFTKLIFNTCGIDIEDEIPLDLIKKLILEKTSNSDLLCMFCGANV